MKLYTGSIGLLLIAVVAAAANQVMEEKIKQVFTVCATELGIKEENMGPSKWSEERTRDRDCFDACALHKLGIMESGKLSKDGFVKLLGESGDEKEDKMAEALEIGNACMDAAGDSSDECELAGAFSTCFHEKTKGFHKE